MHMFRRVIDPRLHRTVEMGERFGATPETHPFAEVIPVGSAPLARSTRNPGFDCDVLAGTEMGDEGPNRSDDSC